jgi:hypothetical protein
VPFCSLSDSTSFLRTNPRSNKIGAGQVLTKRCFQAAFRFQRQRSRPSAPRPVAKRRRAAGRVTAPGVMLILLMGTRGQCVDKTLTRQRKSRRALRRRPLLAAAGSACPVPPPSIWTEGSGDSVNEKLTSGSTSSRSSRLNSKIAALDLR